MVTVDEWLVDRRVIQGIEEYGEFTDVNGNACLFDADDLDNGLDGTGAPSDAPLRPTVETEVNLALRLPYTDTRGSHGSDCDTVTTRRPNSLPSTNCSLLHVGCQAISDDI